MPGYNAALFRVELDCVPPSIFSHVCVDVCVYVNGGRAGCVRTGLCLYVFVLYNSTCMVYLHSIS